MKEKGHVLAAALLALVCLQLTLTSNSQAALEPTPTYAPGAFFGSSGSEPGQFGNNPGQIAAEPGNGNLLVTDTGNGRVEVFSTDAGGNPSFLTTLGAGTLVTPVGIAVDQGTGAIYVSDSGAGKIFRFTSDGAPTPTYTLDGTFTNPTELGSFASTLAVDPTTHDLLVADSGSQEVRRFDVGDGHLIKAFNGATSPGGQFTSLRGVAVAPSGRIFVADQVYPEAPYVTDDGARVEQFDAAGNPLGQLQGTVQEGAVGVDPLSGAVVVGWHNSGFSPPRQLALYEDSDSPVSSTSFPSWVEGATVSAVVASSHYVWALTEIVFGYIGGPGIQPFLPAEIPAAEVDPIHVIGETSAHVTGSVAPGTLSGSGTARFEYSLDGSSWSSLPEQGGITGPGETSISGDLADLRPNTVYSVRIHIANDDFSANSPVATFTTSSVAPGVEISSVTDRTATSVVLNGRVNPYGQQTAYHFEYGETSAYGNTAPAAAEDVAGNGYGPRLASHAVSGLRPSTTYHYRLVAHNATGANATPDRTFTTRRASEPTRAYEQVTPVDKHGLVVSGAGSHMAEAAGNGIVYQVRHAYDAPDTAASVNAARYAAVRTDTGWELRQLDVAQAVSKDPTAPIFNASLAVSADLSHALVGSELKLAPGAVEGVGNLYRRDLATGGLELVATGLTREDTIMQVSLYGFYGGSRDFSRIVFLSRNQLTPEAGPAEFQIYEWSVDGGLRVISTLPGGAPPVGRSTGVLAPYWPARNSVSADASRSYFVQGGELYLSEDGVSKLVSPPGGSGVAFLDMTPDGRFAAYMEGSAGVASLYRYDRDTNTRVLVGDIAKEEYFWGMSDDGSSIFLGGTSGSLYAWHEGTTSTMATIDGSANIVSQGVAASSDGRYFTFVIDNLANQQYDNRNPPRCGDRCREVQVYDVQDQTLTCVSCPADGSISTGHAELSMVGAPEFNHYGAPFVNDKGQVFFDTPTALVAADTNDRRDVYEYQDGEVWLISPGTGDYDATLFDVSADGGNIFFLTPESLVGQDQDGRPDLYDARVGGGIASQSPGRVPSRGGGDCRAPLATPPAALAVASESISGRLQARRHKARHHKAQHHRRKAGKHKSKHKKRARGSAKSDRTIGK